MRLSFAVSGPPVPYQRPGQGRGGHRFTEPASAEYMFRVGAAAMKAIAEQPWPARTLHRSKSGGAVQRGPKGQFGLVVTVYRAARRGDITNFVKSVEDALTKACVWWDDAMVIDLHAHLREDKESPRTEITVDMRGQ